MSLPPGFLDEIRARTSLAQVVGRKVIWDPRKSNHGKGDLWAPCPFHEEKTASFHVDDRKGFYYCFGCHAKGDAISFVKDTENVGFMEAVEVLAREAGMEMPARDPQVQIKMDRATRLAEVMEQAVQLYRMQLKTGAGQDARAYLSGRGLTDAVIDRWDIGYAPAGWQGLWDHLRGKGVAEDLILDAGLAKPSNKGGTPYDTFRDRIMFPIRDARGRAIAFGGRAMQPGESAKYLNSPETALFDKGRTLFNHGPARSAAGKDHALIVAEGYMDVIALSEAGFPASVAPLGTAVTEHQLEMLWRIAPEPVIALDGDTAGLRAAMRVVDLALPMLSAGRSLRFAIMPDGQDPDDLLRAEGPQAVRDVLDGALPLVELLWRRETDGHVFDSPERKAALQKVLRTKVALIEDADLRALYERDLKARSWALFAPKRGSGPMLRGRASAPADPLPQTRASALAGAGATDPDSVRESVVLAILATSPQLIAEFVDVLPAFACTDPHAARIRDALVGHSGAIDTIAEALDQEALENLVSLRHVAINPCVRTPGDLDLARMTVSEAIAKMTAARGLSAEIAEAVEDIDGFADEAVTWRLAEATRVAHRADRNLTVDKAEFDVGENGAQINRDERSAFDALLASLAISKPDESEGR